LEKNNAFKRAGEKDGRLEDLTQQAVCTRENITEAIAHALRSAGYTSLDRQAKALGLHRSTAWTIVANQHKAGRLSKKTVTRILENPETPHAVRVVVQRYLSEQRLTAP
jgi:hypothetical protein